MCVGCLWSDCTSGCLDAVKESCETNDFTRGALLHAFQLACVYGNTSVAIFLADYVGITREDIAQDDFLILRLVCSEGHTNELCSRIHNNVAKWMIVHFNLSKADVQARDGFIFKLPCQELSWFLHVRYG